MNSATGQMCCDISRIIFFAAQVLDIVNNTVDCTIGERYVSHSQRGKEDVVMYFVNLLIQYIYASQSFNYLKSNQSAAVWPCNCYKEMNIKLI